LRWGYINGHGTRITRNNPRDFLEAAQHLYLALKRYRLGDSDAVVPPLNTIDRSKIAHYLETLTDSSGHNRHQAWLKAINQGEFSFGPSPVTAQLSYVDKGKNSWKFNALGTEKLKDSPEDIFPFRNDFLNSNWKLFHDALQAHHFYVLHELLPNYGICVA
jgi:hypothetical protein